MSHSSRKTPAQTLACLLLSLPFCMFCWYCLKLQTENILSGPRIFSAAPFLITNANELECKCSLHNSPVVLYVFAFRVPLLLAFLTVSCVWVVGIFMLSYCGYLSMSVCFANGYHLYNEYAYTCALHIYISYFYIKAFVDHEKKGNFQIFFWPLRNSRRHTAVLLCTGCNS